MKKIFLLTTVLLLSLVLFDACNKDDEDSNSKPTITFKTGTHLESGMKYVDSDTSMAENSIFRVGITAVSNSGKDLKDFKITRTFENGTPEKVLDSIITGESLSFDRVFTAKNQAGTEVWTFSVSDNYGNSNSLDLIITTFEQTVGMVYYQGITLGSYDSLAPGGFMDARAGVSCKFDSATIKAATIDWVFMDAGNYGISFFAPNDAVTEQYYPGIAQWQTRNATKFTNTTNCSETQFDAINNGSSLVIYASGANMTRLSEAEIGTISAGDIFGFITAPGNGSKSGLIKITAVNKNYGNHGISTITFDIKIQN